MTKALEFVKTLNENQSQTKVTMTHVLGHAIACSMTYIRRDMGRLAWGHFRHDKELGLTILCDVEGGQDLVPITLWDA